MDTEVCGGVSVGEPYYTDSGGGRTLQEGLSQGEQAESGRTAESESGRHTARHGRKPEKETKVCESRSKR